VFNCGGGSITNDKGSKISYKEEYAYIGKVIDGVGIGVCDWGYFSGSGGEEEECGGGR
jgi:hypothetical protein